MKEFDLGAFMLGLSFSFLLMGAIGAFLCCRFPKMANGISHVSLFFAGLFGGIVALRVVLLRETVSLSAWHVLPDMELLFRVDQLSAFFLLIVSVVVMAISIYSIGYSTHYYKKGLLGTGLPLFVFSMIAVVTVENGFFFLLFWELMAVVSFFLVMVEHEKSAVRHAGFVYMVMTHFGTLFIMLSFLTLFYFSGNFQFNSFASIGPSMPYWTKNIIFLMAFIGFGTKAGLIPLHIWLPRAHPVAPSHVSTLMSAVMIKTAIYGFMRVSYDFLGAGPAWWGIVVLAIGAISALLGILYGIVENDMKRFLAYSSVENMGIIFMGIGTSLIFYAEHHPLLGAFALTAALMHTLNHALFKGVLFMGAGAVHYATGTKNINQLGGLIHHLPWTAGLFLVGGIALAALPPLNGFVSEWALFQSLFHLLLDTEWKWLGMLAVASLGLTGAVVASAVVKQFGIAFLGVARTSQAENAKEVPLTMRLGMGILAIGSLLLGILPGLVLEITAGSVGKYFNTPVTGKNLFSFPFVDESRNGLLLGNVLILLALFLFLCLLILRLWVGKSRIQVNETWNCGMSLQPSMQYTGTSYSNPFILIFQWLYRPRQQIDVQREHTYFPKRFGYILQVPSFIELKLYRPIVRFVLFISKHIRKIQNGSVQGYLSYMIVTLILLLLWFCR